MTYVDDMMIAGDESVVTSVMKELQSKWTTSTPDRVSSVPIRFLGTEITNMNMMAVMFGCCRKSPTCGT